MADDPEPRETLKGLGRNANLAAWLGLFLLVFAVAGLALYVGDSQTAIDAGRPVTAAHHSP